MVEEVLILSRHVSNSNTPAMTLHAIGILVYCHMVKMVKREVKMVF